jgi:hypothetical protein
LIFSRCGVCAGSPYIPYIGRFLRVSAVASRDVV